MACFHPLRAWRTPSGEIQLHKEIKDAISLRLPCGGCLGCRMAYAQAWALRCQLELQQHKSAVFTTLTYDDKYVPPALPAPKEVLPLWIKRLRKNTGKKLRFYACAEYGERTQRPHFHAILYGIDMADTSLVESTWGLGHTRTEPISPARIAYTAGYCHKKVDYKHNEHQRTNPTTGETYTWRPPYKLMSLRPGIGGEARKWTQSWRLYAIKDGHKMAVPRYLHEAWKAQATEREKEELEYEKYKRTLSRDEIDLKAAEQIAKKQLQIQGEKRTYDNDKRIRKP